jgi:hypothetical protein
MHMQQSLTGGNLTGKIYGHPAEAEIDVAVHMHDIGIPLTIRFLNRYGTVGPPRSHYVSAE